MRFFRIASFLSVFVVLAMIPFFVNKHERGAAPVVSETVATDEQVEPSETVETVPYVEPETTEPETEAPKIEETVTEVEDTEPGFCNENYERTIIAFDIDEPAVAEYYVSVSLDEALYLAMSLASRGIDMSVEDMIAELEKAYNEIESKEGLDSADEKHQEDVQGEEEPASVTITPPVKEPDETTGEPEPVTEATEAITTETVVAETTKEPETTAEQTTVPETTVPETTVPETTEPETMVPGVTTAPDKPEPTVPEDFKSKKYETSFSRDSEEVKILAQCLKGEAGASHSDMQKAAVIWCVLNRVDSEDRYYPDDIISVVTQPYQFTGYHAQQPVRDDLVDIVMDVLGRWEAEHRGETNVGRVLPKDYLFFAGKTSTNYFRKTYRITEDTVYWDWSLPNPYDS